MKRAFIKILIRLIAISIILLGCNFVYIYISQEEDIQEHSDIINLLREAQYNADVVYFGESSNYTFKEDDKDKRMISEMINDFYADLRLKTVTKGAIHADIFNVLLKHIPEDSEVKTIIITMNLRSFNAQWIFSISL